MGISEEKTSGGYRFVDERGNKQTVIVGFPNIENESEDNYQIQVFDRHLI